MLHNLALNGTDTQPLLAEKRSRLGNDLSPNPALKSVSKKLSNLNDFDSLKNNLLKSFNF